MSLLPSQEASKYVVSLRVNQGSISLVHNTDRLDDHMNSTPHQITGPVAYMRAGTSLRVR